MPETPALSFVVPVRNDAIRLRRCLASIAATDRTDSPIEVIVLDNGSDDGSAEVAHQAGATVLELPDLTVAKLRNRGASAARGQILAFVDADHEIGLEWSRAAVEALQSQDVAAAGDECHPPSRGTWVQSAYDAFRTHAPGRREVSWLGSGNMAVRTDVFRELGGFDTSLVTCEDVDLCLRIRRVGWKLVADDRMYSIHHGDPATLLKLFKGELWRGRDNLRVSLRAPLGWRELPSLLIPVLDLGALVALAAGGLSGTRTGLLAVTAGVFVLAGFAALRTLRMAANTRSMNPLRLVQFYAVAFVYDMARALALVARKGHHRNTRPKR